MYDLQPGSWQDWATIVVFGGFLAFIAWRIYQN